MIKYGVFSFGILTYLASFAFALQNCDSDKKYLKDVRVTDCALDASGKRCNLIKGKNVTIEIDFIAKTSSNTIEMVLHGVVLEVPLPFPIPNSDGCKDSGITCPITEGQQYTFKNVMFVQKAYPELVVDVKWELKDSNGDLLVCVLIPSQIRKHA